MIVIDEGKCAACGQCHLVCPVDAFEGWGIAKIKEEECTDCGICVEYCPTDALEVKK